ncbi:MAG: TAT-variant-translocated molybdopterin oxidoreductase [Chitinophagales bacterium]|nr:TAT-variant-translocated molybdopterin oxidoreductase [Chitinophagales bacterium]
MSEIKYWKSLEELNETPEYKDKASKEFQEEIPGLDMFESASEGSGTDRRDFLKVMGFSVSAAALAASCKTPVKKAVPYVFNGNEQIPEVVPGVADFYATTYYDGSSFVNLVAKVREGRPIKLEGNTDAPFTKGGTSARSQASILSLYDATRLKCPVKGNKAISWNQADKEITSKLAEINAAGGKIAILTGSLGSVVTKKAIEKLKVKYSNAVHVAYDAVSQYAIRKANTISLGTGIIPSYQFDKANVIVGFNCDFLGTWLNPVEFAKQYATNRVPSKENPTMSRHHQFQSAMTITGASADYRYPIKPSEEKLALIALYNAVAAKVGGSVISGAKAFANKAAIDKVAGELAANKGRSLVVSGTNNVENQLLVNAINGLLGNYGITITGRSLNVKEGNDDALATLVADIKSGAVQGLILLGANPVYNTPYADVFKSAIGKLKLSVSLNDRSDETGSLAQYVCPDNHYLETWDLLEPKSGYYCFVQPTINPIFDTRAASETLTKWAGEQTTAYDLVKAESAAMGSWENNLQLGFVDNSSAAGVSCNVGASIAGVNASAGAASGTEVVFYEKVAIGDGTFANNPLLQEMPDPISKTTWDNYVCVPYSWAKEKDMKLWLREAPIAKVSFNGKSVELPVMISFGLPKDTVAIAVGYGRTKAGKAGDNVGKNVYDLLKPGQFSADNVKIELTGKGYKLGMNQQYHTLQEDNNLPSRPRRYRNSIIKEANLKQYQAKHNAGNEDREEIKEHLLTLYGYHPYQSHHWALSVDMNSCIGCGACVIACNVENNVPVVGKERVYKGQEMHWMRIDRYFSGDPDNPDVSFQPMMCQHCNNAPCENVCPVNATNHSSEGLNQMAYNRCIGTRYCANNCPFKVRRFNWLDYQGNDSFGKWTDATAAEYMYEDLTRMVLNPDVTVRTRGVIEKCSMCVQRIQEGKLTAKKENRTLRDGDIKTACQTSCPTNAIIFGDINDGNSAVHKAFFEEERNYHLFEELHFLTNVGYKVKVRNKDEEPALYFTPVMKEEDIKGIVK